jgi:hypothetical protein
MSLFYRQCFRRHFCGALALLPRVASLFSGLLLFLWGESCTIGIYREYTLQTEEETTWAYDEAARARGAEEHANFPIAAAGTTA